MSSDLLLIYVIMIGLFIVLSGKIPALIGFKGISRFMILSIDDELKPYYFIYNPKKYRKVLNSKKFDKFLIS